ncbi:MAG: ADP-ribosylglycohydrolase family protein [Betaproteobacteria bacterium]
MEPRNVARGALFGALIGDAAGATLEFLGRPPTPGECAGAMRMTGGGILGTAPGQITDDGELALCLAYGLTGRDTYDADRVAQKYLDWYGSRPFDVGNATANAFSVRVPGGQGVASAVRAAAQRNSASKANGALMRAAPLGVWGARLTPEALRVAACDDTSLSHPHVTCQFATAAYVIAIRHLMVSPGDARGALDAAGAVLAVPEAREVAGWFSDALAGKDTGYYPQAGFVRHGFVHAFRHLALGTSYEGALAETLLGGGDTDTNACIVGGLVGALHGDLGIPVPMQRALLDCNTAAGRPRPVWLATTRLDDVVAGLLEPGSP